MRERWIFVEARGGSYSPETVLRALLDQKINPTRLIVFCGKAVAYNTPYLGIETREFADVVALAAAAVHGQNAFEKIYLLNTLEPGLEAFEMFRACARLS